MLNDKFIVIFCIVDVEGVHKPTFWDLLPFVIYRLFVSSIHKARMRREYYRQEKIKQQLLKEEEEREREKQLGISLINSDNLGC